MTSSKFTWINFYKELSDKLLTYRDRRDDLINKLATVYESIGMSLPKLEADGLQDIDPFTVFGLFNKGITDANRQKIIAGIAEVFDRIYPEFYTEREKETIEKLFPTCESISIDYAVMEKAERIYVLPAEFGWSDLGSWGSLHSLLPKDNRNNAIVGENIRLYECNNCIVHTPHLKQAVIQGLDGYIIAEKEGTLLICKLAEEQRIKEFSKA